MSNTSWKDGVIVTDSGDLIARPQMTFGELRVSRLGASAKIEESSPGYPRIVIMPVLISGYECCVSVGFDHDRLDRAVVVVTDDTAKRFSFVTGFASTPEGPEVKFLEEWVCREVGTKPPVNFAWGGIGEVWDSKAGWARILFLYGTRDARNRLSPAGHT